MSKREQLEKELHNYKLIGTSVEERLKTKFAKLIAERDNLKNVLTEKDVQLVEAERKTIRMENKIEVMQAKLATLNHRLRSSMENLSMTADIVELVQRGGKGAKSRSSNVCFTYKQVTTGETDEMEVEEAQDDEVEDNEAEDDQVEDDEVCDVNVEDKSKDMDANSVEIENDAENKEVLEAEPIAIDADDTVNISDDDADSQKSITVIAGFDL